MRRLNGSVSHNRMGSAPQAQRSPESHIPTVAGPTVLIQSTGREMWKRRPITRPNIPATTPRAEIPYTRARAGPPRHPSTPDPRLRLLLRDRLLRRPLPRDAGRGLIRLHLPDRPAFFRRSFWVPRPSP